MEDIDCITAGPDAPGLTEQKVINEAIAKGWQREAAGEYPRDYYLARATVWLHNYYQRHSEPSPLWSRIKKAISDWLFVLRHRALYTEYIQRAKLGEARKDFNRGPGYYFTTGIIMYDALKDPKLQCLELPMKSGKIAFIRLIDFKLCRQDDMIEESWWQILGYKGDKMIADMTFREFVEFIAPNMKTREEE